ncbi:unnamed protein product [Coffea canephora]|uniref:Uncharacterized protein n=1 Tax=Coffea canephora TaxID=49390 RepID=A0A068UFJ6_COFCA|nr:unnamed protein product [Coffea canephora]
MDAVVKVFCVHTGRIFRSPGSGRGSIVRVVVGQKGRGEEERERERKKKRGSGGRNSDRRRKWWW